MNAGNIGRRTAGWLRRRAEDVLAGLLGVMFFAFVVQIVFRYFFNLPTGWTTELTVVTWLWMVLWGAAFVVKETEEIRIDLVTGMVDRRRRMAMALATGVATVFLYAVSLPASYSYVSFMKVEKSSYLKIPMHWLYSIWRRAICGSAAPTAAGRRTRSSTSIRASCSSTATSPTSSSTPTSTASRCCSTRSTCSGSST